MKDQSWDFGFKALFNPGFASFWGVSPQASRIAIGILAT